MTDLDLEPDDLADWAATLPVEAAPAPKPPRPQRPSEMLAAWRADPDREHDVILCSYVESSPFGSSTSTSYGMLDIQYPTKIAKFGTRIGSVVSELAKVRSGARTLGWTNLSEVRKVVPLSDGGKPWDRYARLVPAAPAVLDPAAAAEAAKAAKVKPAPLLIQASEPVPLHTVKFPVYDRSAGGFRIIERAFGTPELKTFIKVALDAILTSDPKAVVEPAFHLDATGPTVNGPQRLHPERERQDWQCRHRAVDHAASAMWTSSGVLHTSRSTRFLNSINACINEWHYNSGSQIASVLRTMRVPSGFDKYVRESIHFTPDAWAFYEDHAPYMIWNAQEGYWEARPLPEWNTPPVIRDPQHSTWEFPDPKVF